MIIEAYQITGKEHSPDNVYVRGEASCAEKASSKRPCQVVRLYTA